MTKGEHKTPEYLEINPNGKIPALVDGDTKLWESNAIMQYISSDSSLWPPNKSRYDIARWQFWSNAHLGQATGTIAFERVFKANFGMGDADEAKVEAALANFERFAGVLDGCLEGRDWLVGDAVSLADFSVAADFQYIPAAGVDMSAYANITRWLAGLDEIDAWSKTAPQLG